MLKFVFAAIIFGFIAIAIIVMVVINFTYKSVKKLREEVEDNYYRNQKMKEQKEKYSFNNDYFKSSKGGRRQSRTQAQYEQREQASRDKNPFGDDYFKGKQQEQPKADQKNTARRTTTSSGVTIIDDRDQEEKRKIFDHSDGEYVEFEEV